MYTHKNNKRNIAPGHDQLNCSPSEQQGGGTVYKSTKVNKKSPWINRILEFTFLFQSSTEVAVCDHHQYGEYNTTEHARTACIKCEQLE